MQRIAAEVHERATGECEAPARVVGLGFGHLHHDLDTLEGAQGAVFEQAEHAAGDGVEEVVESLHDHRAADARRLAHHLGFGGVARERLLGQHCLTGLDGGHVPRCMERVGQRVVDDVNLGVGDQVGIGIHHPLHPVAAGERLRTATVTGGHGDETVPERRGGGDDGQLRDARGAQHTDPQPGHGVMLRR